MSFRVLAVLVVMFTCVPVHAATQVTAINEKAQPQVKKTVEELQQALLADKEIVALILMLQDNPEVQVLLQEPEVVNALASGDIDALVGNPRFLDLLNNPQIQEIQKRVKR